MASSKNVTFTALVAMATVVITAFAIAALYIGRDILIPLALAALLSFLLSPLVTRLERWVGRIAATLLAVTVLFSICSGIGWVLTRQVIDLATRLPDYKENIQTKLRSLKTPGAGRFKRFHKTIDELKKDLPGRDLTSADPESETNPPATTAAAPQMTGAESPQPPPSSATPTQVEIVETEHSGPIEQFGAIILQVLGTGALVLLLLICMLLQRENLRGRLMRLIGAGNIPAVTRGMDDAAQRVSRYLLMQLIVNATYGLVIAVALYFIGVPSAFVWGVLATVLRFIPYVGPWIAAAFPIALSLAVTNNWTMPLLTIGLFVVVELLSNNVMEPMLYGSSTGVSAIALILAAVFWTWLWGPVGLALATPLTVCLVVMGRHVPRLGVLSVLLSDEEALAPHEEFYHRLLTPAADDASEFSDAYLKTNSFTELYDSVLIPALAAVERDEKSGELDEAQYVGILQELRDVIEDLGMRPSPASKLESDKAEAEVDSATPPASPDPPAPTCRVLSLPVRAERDELAGAMLAQLLAQNDFPVVNLSAKMTTGELLETVEKEGAEALCISVTPPSTVIHARYLCGKLRARFPKLRLLIGLWGATEQLTETTARLRESGADEVVTTLTDAVVQLSQYAAALAQEAVLLAPPNDEIERLAELQNLHLLDTKAEPVFDRITTKLARILNVPIALITFVDKERQFFKSQFGLPEDLAQARQAPRDVSVCSQVVAMDEVLVIEDLARDRRFARNSLVKERGLRFYAGAPLRTTGGHVLGALCVLDTKPRHFGDHDKRLLQVMAEEVMEAINLRAASRTSEAA
ncbi:MAG TPA: AI-2E family transporter [Chthoniobacteraceae bacterium]|nr:AI-2E family transporter [Chthoniobacteraceae bacterium]